MITLTQTDCFTLGGYFLGCYALGWVTGFLLKSFMKGVEKIT